MPAWGEIVIASSATAVLLYWLYSKDRFRTVGAAVVIGAVTMFFSLLVTGGPISYAIDNGIGDYVAPVLQAAFLIFLLVMAGEWAVDKIRGRRN
jgi:integral membrane sensor domain MASE1